MQPFKGRTPNKRMHFKTGAISTTDVRGKGSQYPPKRAGFSPYGGLEVPLTGATSVVYCNHCKSPVADTETAIRAHRERIHSRIANEEDA